MRWRGGDIGGATTLGDPGRKGKGERWREKVGTECREERIAGGKRHHVFFWSLKIPFSLAPPLPQGHSQCCSILLWEKVWLPGRDCAKPSLPFPPSDGPLCPQSLVGWFWEEKNPTSLQEVLWLPGLPAIGDRVGPAPWLGLGAVVWGWGSQAFTVASAGVVSSHLLLPAAQQRLDSRRLLAPVCLPVNKTWGVGWEAASLLLLLETLKFRKHLLWRCPPSVPDCFWITPTKRPPHSGAAPALQGATANGPGPRLVFGG